jgi:hypothetical protein
MVNPGVVFSVSRIFEGSCAFSWPGGIVWKSLLCIPLGEHQIYAPSLLARLRRR